MSLLSTRHLTAYYVSSLVGSGILVIPAMAAEIAGPAALIAWLALVALSYPVALVFARISVAYPDSSGIVRFLGVCFPPVMARIAALLLLGTMILGNPVVGLAAARYFCHALGITSPWGLTLTAIAVMWGNVAFNLGGLRFGSRAQTAMLSLLVIVLIGVLVLALPATDPANLAPFAPNGLWAVGIAASVCFFSFLGWENVSTVATQVRTPETTFPRAIRLALVAVGGLYLGIAVVYALVVPASDIAGQYAVISDLLARSVGPRAGLAADLIGGVLLFVTSNVWVLAAGRLMSATARDGGLPAWLARTEGRGETPVPALWLLAGLYALVLLGLRLSGQNETAIIHLADLNFLLVYLFTFWAAWRHFPDAATRRRALAALLGTAVFVPFFVSGARWSALAIALVAGWAWWRQSVAIRVGSKA
ncbi:APC family permease [Jeongeupia naejangsanensis]|uniref:Amino acid permease n=1 Tax=Jeongeupia naejangsanensis TaxID=613195 RepID=A0ABS2BP17_9NEIS|nr:amino acid permease [Jeongeupia naejangsanensis]MBM3117160.1 amino acid permease [Jeongeupia naejangsanensis]